MTREELREELRVLTNDSIDEEVITRVDRIMNEWPEPSDTVDFEQRVTALTEERDGLRRELDAERERFRKRFWNGEDDQAREGADTSTPDVTMQTFNLTDNELADMWR